MAGKDMKIQDVLARDLSKKIDPVVKVYDLESLAEDMRQFVITDSLAKEFRKFLDSFTESLQRRIRGGDGGDAMAVWIAGFFGSGKSHLAKVLGYLLQNDVIEPENEQSAIDIFSVHLDDPTLPGASDLRALLYEVENGAWCKTIAFEIKSRLDQANPESVTESCLRAFYESLNLSETIWLARLERKLQDEGKYQGFLNAYKSKTGREWNEDRPEHGFYGDDIAAALSESLEKPIDSIEEMIETYQRDHSRVTAENLAQEITKWLDELAKDVKPKEPHLIFVIDEMGQFIGDDDGKIHELQGIVEQAGVQGKGRIWFICTGQEALDQVVERTGLRLSMLGKLDFRFSTKIPLTGEDVRKVVHQRLLRKKEAKIEAVEKLYKENEGRFEELCRLGIERQLAALESESFVAAYPFMPITIPLVQELFNAMRGFKLSGSERSMIDVTQGTLIELAEQSLGVLTPMDLIFDQVADELSSSEYLGGTGLKQIRDSDRQVPGTPIPPSRVLKTLWLISRENWIPRTPETIAKLLAQTILDDLATLRLGVEETLKALQKAGIVGRDEATGQYRYLSEQERGIEEEIIDNIRNYGVGVAKRKATDLLKSGVLTKAKFSDFRIQLGKSGVIPFCVKLDSEPISSTGEIQIEISSPLSAPNVDQIEQENLARGVKGRVLWWVAAHDETLVEKLKRIEALEKIPNLPKWRNDRSDETQRVIKAKEKEKADLENHVMKLIEVCLKEGTFFYAGDQADLEGSKDFKTINQEFVGVVAQNLYNRFDIADKEYDEANIPRYLKSTTKKVNQLDPKLGLFDAQGHLQRNSPLVETIFDELALRKDEGETLEGKALLEQFSMIPYGWPDSLVRLVLAAMFRGGVVYLQPTDSDQPIYDIDDPRVEGLYTKPTQFRKTRFYPTVGGLTPKEIKVAKEGLIALGETAVPDTAHGLAERIHRVGTGTTEQARRIATRVRDIDLPLPETYKRAEPVTAKALDLRDPVACVRRFIEDRGAWKEVSDFLAAYQEFVDQKRDRSFRSYAQLVEFASAWPNFEETEGGEKAKEAIAEFDAIIASKDIMTKWKALQEATLVVVDHYRKGYKEVLKACENKILAFKADIQEAEVFQRLDKARKTKVLDAFFGSGETLEVPKVDGLKTPEELIEATHHKKKSELEALRMAVPGYRKPIFEMCDKEWIEQLKEKGKDKELKERGEPYRISIRDRLVEKRFASVKEFDEFWEALAKEIRAQIKEDREVILEA